MARVKRSLTAKEWQALPADKQDMYTQDGDKYLLDDDGAEALKSALDRALEREKELKASLAAFDGIDPSKHKELVEAATKLQRQRDLDEKNFDKVLGEEREKMGKEVAMREQRIARLQASLERALVDAEATREIAAQGGNPTLLLPAMRPAIKVREIGEQHIAVVLDPKGEPRLKPDARSTDDFLPIRDYVAELKGNVEYAGAFKGTGSSGSQSSLLPAPSRDKSQEARLDAIVAAIEAGATVAPRP